MNRNTIYKISLITSIVFSVLVFICLFINAFYVFLFSIPLFFFISATVVSKNNIKKEKQIDHVQSLDYAHRDEVKVLCDGSFLYYKDYYRIDNTGDSDDEARVLINNKDMNHYHLFFSCYKQQPFKDSFDYWEMVSLVKAKTMGLKICPQCEYKLLSDEEKIKRVLNNNEYIVIKLTALGGKDNQEVLSYTNIADRVFIEFDYDKLKYYVYDEHGNKLGAISDSVLKKYNLLQDEIENSSCCVYKIEFNENERYICHIAMELCNNNQQEGNSTIKIKKKEFEETIDKCVNLKQIIRIDYNGEAIPKNAKIVTLRNNHKFSADDYLDVFGYQEHKTAKLEYYFFLDKTRKKKDENGKFIYPAIKISSKTILQVPDLSTDEAKKYISISYAERASKNYVVSAEDIDDLSHYFMGKCIFEEQQRIIKTDYCVIDIETTGLDRTEDKIIEISALKIRNNEIVNKFTQLIKPSIPIPSSATAINGITNKMVENAPTLKETLLRFLQFVGDDVVIGHNVGDFDLQFINNACQTELGRSFSNDYIDTLLLARGTFNFVSNYKLSTLCRELNINRSEHRAETDCISTKELYDIIKERRKLKL